MKKNIFSSSLLVLFLGFILALPNYTHAAITVSGDTVSSNADLNATAVGNLSLNADSIRIGDITANTYRGFASNYASSSVTQNAVFGYNKPTGLGVLNAATGTADIFGQVVGIDGTAVSSYSSGTLGFLYAGVFDPWQNGSGSVMDHMTGISVGGGLTAGTATNYYGIRIQVPAKLSGGDITTQAIGLRIEDFTLRGFSAGTIDNIQSRGQTSKNWLEGKVAIGGLSSGDTITVQARITARTAATAGLLINQAASATAEAMQTRDSSSNVLFSMGPIGSSNPRQQFFLYNTLETTPTNYERLALYADSGNNIFRIDSQNGGTGTLRNLTLQTTGGNVGIGTTSPATLLDVNGAATIRGALNTTNCSSAAGSCGSATSGAVTMATSTSTTSVSTTAVTANSNILISEDFSLGARLGVSCNSFEGRSYVVADRTPGVGFSINASSTVIGDPACLSFFIVN